MGKKDSGGSVSGQRQNRLSIPLTEFGLPDWEHMRSSQSDRLLLIARDDEVLRGMLAPTSDAGGDTNVLDVGLTEENIHTALDILDQANALVFRVACARFQKHPFKKLKDGKPAPLEIDMDIAMRSFQLTADQHKELDPRAYRVAKKYSPTWLNKNIDIYMLVGMYLKYQADNAKTAMEMQFKRDFDRLTKAAAQAQAKQRPLDSDVQPVNGRDRTEPAEPTKESLNPGLIPPNMESL